MRSFFHLFVASFLTLAASAAEPRSVEHNETFVPDAILRVTAQDVAVSCYPAKLTVLVNGTTPGPALRIAEGRTTWIRVYNDMEDHNLTMHWHGLSMAMSPFADGTPQVSQWPIPPSHYFDYEMLPEIGSAGTYFYHSHVGFQAVTAAGPLIVEDLQAPYSYTEDKIIFISDVFTKSDEEIEHGLVATPIEWSGESAMVIVNGDGGGSADGVFCNSSLSIIDVEPNTTYRLRFIGATALTFASIAIEGHDSLSVIEADGSYTQPYNTSFMQVGSGQRYSVLLTTMANPRPNGTYLIQLESRDRPTMTQGFAVLRYSQNNDNTTKYYPPISAPLSLPKTTVDFLDYNLRALPGHKGSFPKASEVTRRVVIDVHQYVNGMTYWAQNKINWTEEFPAEPYLVSLYKNEGRGFPSMERALANGGVDPETRAFPAEIGEVLEIVIQNTGSDSGGIDAHPFHAHGSHYYDLGSGNGTYNATENDAKWDALGPDAEPVLRDTTMLYRYAPKAANGTIQGWRAWRLRVDQPGAWMVHCHILQHMVMGMQTVWVMGNETELLGRVPAPAVEGYMTFGGSVYGNDTHFPSVVHFQDKWFDEQ